MDVISRRYAESLFDLAKEEHAVESYQKDMEKIAEVFQEQSFVRFFSHVALSDDIKVNILKKSFENQVSHYVFNFLLLLIKKRRIRYIEGICHEFQSLCYDYFGMKVGKVYSAFPLSQDDMTRIERSISVKVGKKVKLRVVIDERLIGGIKVEIDNHIYDDSLSYQLESLRKELLRK
ncbi:MAG: F0F1 ATP synthase subunit delta [Longibaculum sp.]